MAVVTIDLDHFLTLKKDGEIVTAEDWNKLVALFQSINQNANELLTLIKDVNDVRADMVNIVSNGVADDSVGYDKLEKLDKTKQVYVLNTDETPVPGVVYYTLEDTEYIPHENLTEFENVQYYVVNTVASNAAIAAADVIADGVIPHTKLKLGTIVEAVCSDLLLGGLLSDNVTVYLDKGFSGVFKKTDSLGTQHTKTITFEKAHKALIVINNNCISLYTTVANAPDVHIGSEYAQGYYQGLYINTLIGANKLSLAPQQLVFGTDGHEIAGRPIDLSGGGIYTQLSRAYYDYSKKTLQVSVKYVRRTNVDVPYSFGNLIIGL